MGRYSSAWNTRFGQGHPSTSFSPLNAFNVEQFESSTTVVSPIGLPLWLYVELAYWHRSALSIACTTGSPLKNCSDLSLLLSSVTLQRGKTPNSIHITLEVGNPLPYVSADTFYRVLRIYGTIYCRCPWAAVIAYYQVNRLLVCPLSHKNLPVY